MSDERPDPLSDVIRGLGLLLRAAKTTVERVPTKGLEQVVAETAREVGRAIENVAEVLEREVFRGSGSSGKPGTRGDSGETSGPASPGDSPPESPRDPQDPPASPPSRPT